MLASTLSLRAPRLATVLSHKCCIPLPVRAGPTCTRQPLSVRHRTSFQSPHNCHCALFAYPLFRPAQNSLGRVFACLFCFFFFFFCLLLLLLLLLLLSSSFIFFFYLLLLSSSFIFFFYIFFYYRLLLLHLLLRPVNACFEGYFQRVLKNFAKKNNLQRKIMVKYSLGFLLPHMPQLPLSLSALL